METCRRAAAGALLLLLVPHAAAAARLSSAGAGAGVTAEVTAAAAAATEAMARAADASLSPPRLLSANATSIEVAWDDGAPVAGATYTLYADSFFGRWSGFAAVCTAGAERLCAIGHLMPGTATTLYVVATAQDGKPLARSANATLSAADAPRCGNAADAAAWRDHFAALNGDVQGCLTSCALDGADCATGCVRRKDGLSADCAGCWGAYLDCAEDHCLGHCLSPASRACHECSVAHCLPAAKACTGIPDEYFPTVTATAATVAVAERGASTGA